MKGRGRGRFFYEMVDFPIRNRQFRVSGWSGAFWEPLETEKKKNVLARFAILRTARNAKKISRISFKHFAIFAKFCETSPKRRLRGGAAEKGLKVSGGSVKRYCTASSPRVWSVAALF